MKEFDELLDIAYAEIYYHAVHYETEGRIAHDLSIQDLCYECKQMAVDLVNRYDNSCEDLCPSFYDMLDLFVRTELLRKWPPIKEYIVPYTVTVCFNRRVWAKNGKDAEDQARVFKNTDAFKELVRQKLDVHDNGEMVITTFKTPCHAKKED